MRLTRRKTGRRDHMRVSCLRAEAAREFAAGGRGDRVPVHESGPWGGGGRLRDGWNRRRVRALAKAVAVTDQAVAHEAAHSPTAVAADRRPVSVADSPLRDRVVLVVG